MGSLEPGKLADIVLWPRNSFGIKPWMVIKSGIVVWAAMGDGNASQDQLRADHAAADVGGARDGSRRHLG